MKRERKLKLTQLLIFTVGLLIIFFTYFQKERSDEEKIISHDKLEIDCYNIFDLQNFLSDEKIQNILPTIKYIFINEAQFFQNFKKSILFLKNDLNTHIILCGLDLDFKREKFTTDDIMNKEQTLRHMLKPNTWNEIHYMVEDAGFKTVEQFWRNHNFLGAIAIK